MVAFIRSSTLARFADVMTWQGLFVIVTFSLNSVTFTLGIVETSASVVLTVVATMPVFAAILSVFLLQERQEGLAGRPFSPLWLVLASW